MGKNGRLCCRGTGIRPFEWNSLPGSEFICISVALWLAEERWNENHSKLLTPAQELRRNAQPLLWCGGTEPALFLCLLHQSSRDCGGGRAHAEGGERKWAKGRKGTARMSSELDCRPKMNALLFFLLSGAAQLNPASAIQHSASSFPSEIILNRSPRSLKVYPGTEIRAAKWDFCF